MKFKMRAVALVLCMMCVMAFSFPMAVYATGGGGLDDLSGQSTGPNTDTANAGQTGSQTGQSGDGAIEDYLRGYTPVTGENMQQAGTIASPIVSAIGTISGFIVMIVSAAIFMVTALDLCYIGLPFMRGLLNPSYNMAGGAAMGGGMPGMGGMGMGMGMGRMGMGGMGGMAGGAAPMGEHGLRRKWVSDEAVYCVQTYAMGAAAPAMGGGMPGMGGMGMGMGGMAGGMGAMGGAQQQMPMKSVIFEYLKKRSFFLIIFAIATVVLMSSLFTDCGLNLAALLTKVVNRFSGQVTNVNF